MKIKDSEVRKRCACGNDTYHRTVEQTPEGLWRPIWKCANCAARTPRRVRYYSRVRSLPDK